MTSNSRPPGHSLGLRTKDYGACAKREVSGRRRCASPMMPILGRWVSVVFAVGALVLVSPAAASLSGHTLAAGSGTRGAVPSPGLVHTESSSPAASWDNGVVRLQFPSPAPVFTVASIADARVTSSHVLAGIAEVNGSGGLIAFAEFGDPNVSWSFAQSTVSGALIVRVSAAVPVHPAHGEWERGDDVGEEKGTMLGDASVVVSFFLNASSAPAPATVRFAVNVTNWPWLRASDSLGLQVGMVATGSTGIVAGIPANALVETRTGTGATVATLSWASDASVRYVNGTAGTSAVGAYRNISSGGSTSFVRLIFGAVSGGYTALSYDPWIQLNLAAFGLQSVPAWLFTTASLAALGAAGVTVGGLAVLAARRRAASEEDP